MAYTKQGFVDNETKLTAAHLIKMEDGIIAAQNSASTNSKEIGNIKNSLNTIPIEVVYKIALPFTESGAVIACHPVEGHPLNVTSCIEPIQSGSGDPYPGGGGKNLLNYDLWKTVKINDGTAVWQDNGVILTANNADCYTRYSASDFPCAIPVNIGDTIVMSWEHSGAEGLVYIFGNGGTSSMTNVYSSVKTLKYVVPDGITFITIRLGVQGTGNTATYKNIQVEKGTTATAYTPYSNIRPISGHTGAKLTKCGKNLLPNTATTQTVNGVTFTVSNDGSITANGTATGTVTYNIGFPVLMAGSYVVSGSVSGVSVILRRKKADGTYGYTSTQNGTETQVVLDGTEKELYVYAQISSGVAVSGATLKPMIRLATETDAAYEPYRGANTYVMDFGRNLAKSIHATGYTSLYSNCLYVDADFKPNTTYTISFIANAENVDRVLYLNETLVSYKEFRITGARQSITFTTKEYMSSNPIAGKGHIMFKNGTELAAPMTFTDVQLELGSTATDYASYNSAILAQTGGMVYGGTLDWNKGVLTVDRAIVTLTGTENFQFSSNSAGRFVYYGLQNVIKPFSNSTIVAPIVCSHYKPSTADYLYNTPDAYAIAQNNGTEIWFSDTGFDSPSAFKAYLSAQNAAGTPVQVCYKLANPTTIQLTPQEILAIEGANTLYSENGKMDVSGRVDPIWINEQLMNRIAALEAAIINNI